MGFIINSYEKCISNKTINGKQCTITWYVDENNLSQVDMKLLRKYIKQ